MQPWLAGAAVLLWLLSAQQHRKPRGYLMAAASRHDVFKPATRLGIRNPAGWSCIADCHRMGVRLAATIWLSVQRAVARIDGTPKYAHATALLFATRA